LAGLVGALAVGALPAAAQASGPDSSGAAAAIGFLNQQRQANGIPAFTGIDNSLATSWCPNESQTPVTESRVLAGGSDPVSFTASSSPWSAAPLHQILMYDPLARTAGWATMTDAPFDGGEVMPYLECMGFGDEGADPPAPTAYTFFSELGRDAVPTSMDVVNEGPFAPQELAGISQGTPTGPQPIFYLLGMGRVRAVSWSLSDRSTGATVPGVSIVTSYDAQAAGYDPTIMWNNAVMIPPVLQPATIYDGQAKFTGDNGTCVQESYSFATQQSDGSALGVSLPGISTSSCSSSSGAGGGGATIANPAPPHVKARWARRTFVLRSALRRGERLTVKVRGHVRSTTRSRLRLHGRYARTIRVWVTRGGRSSRHVLVHVRRV
jgi:hypothetical protein